MVTTQIEGIDVDFPFQPYPCQIKYMENLMKSFKLGWNSALESPTGTGKTLCLLCASLAWLQHEKSKFLFASSLAAQPQEANSQQTPTSIGSVAQNPNELGSKIDDSKTGLFCPAKIIYTSRTHSQLVQVVKELNKTSYRNLIKVTILGSRDQMCINNDVIKEENSVTRNNLCRAKVKTRTCLFYNNLEKNNYSDKSFQTEYVNDIEDIVALGKELKICPYFKARQNQSNSDLILMPYNYVLDPVIRKVNGIDLRGNIVIFDEAHNLEKICEEAASVQLTSKDVRLALKEAKDVFAQLTSEEEAVRKRMDETSAAFGKAVPPDDQLLTQHYEQIKKEELAHLIVMLSNLVEQLEAVAEELGEWQKPKGGKAAYGHCTTGEPEVPGLIKQGQFCFELLEKSGILAHFRDALCLLIDNIVAYLTQTLTNSLWHSRGAGLQRFQAFVSTVYCKGMKSIRRAGSVLFSDASRCFKVYICVDDSARKDGTTGSDVASTSKPIVINYWCFSAGHGMADVYETGARSLIVTSGTLTPLKTFVDELRIPFHIQFSNDHIVKQDQVWTGILTRGPNLCSLNGSFINRQTDTFMTTLGMSMCELAKIVPQGVLVFFASYRQMDTCIAHWQREGIWAKLANTKFVFVEPKNKDQLQICHGEFLAKVNDSTLNGAVFFAVCRGKLSEGIDFADSHGRAVILVGLPYPPVYDPRVVLKKHYLLDVCKDRDSKSSSKFSLTASEWYELEAMRSINQAAGRVIRHKDDFGAVILADQRFQFKDRKYFASWMQPQLTVYEDFASLSDSLKSFFSKHRIEAKRAPVTKSVSAMISAQSASVRAKPSVISSASNVSENEVKKIESTTTCRKELNLSAAVRKENAYEWASKQNIATNSFNLAAFDIEQPLSDSKSTVSSEEELGTALAKRKALFDLFNPKKTGIFPDADECTTNLCLREQYDTDTLCSRASQKSNATIFDIIDEEQSHNERAQTSSAVGKSHSVPFRSTDSRSCLDRNSQANNKSARKRIIVTTNASPERTEKSPRVRCQSPAKPTEPSSSSALSALTMKKFRQGIETAEDRAKEERRRSSVLRMLEAEEERVAANEPQQLPPTQNSGPRQQRSEFEFRKLTAPEYMTLLRSLPNAASFRAKMMSLASAYKNGSSLEKLVDDLATLFLPDFPNAFKGFYTFVKPEHKAAFSRQIAQRFSRA